MKKYSARIYLYHPYESSLSVLVPLLRYNTILLSMARPRTKKSETLHALFGNTDDTDVSKKLIQKLLQYNMKYEEITHVILSHSERAFLDARLITLEDYYRELQGAKKSEVENFLASIPDFELTTK